MDKDAAAIELFNDGKTYQQISEAIGQSRLHTGLLISRLRTEGKIGYRNASRRRGKPVSADVIQIRTEDPVSLLRAYQLAHKESDKRMAILLGSSVSSYQNWLHGRNRPSVTFSARIQELVNNGKVDLPNRPKKKPAPKTDIPWHSPYCSLSATTMRTDSTRLRRILRAVWDYFLFR